MDSKAILDLYVEPDAKDYQIYSFLQNFVKKDLGYFHFFNLLSPEQKKLVYQNNSFQDTFLKKINRLPEEEFNSYFFDGFIDALSRDQIISNFVNHHPNNEKLKKYVVDMETNNKINFDNIIMHMTDAYTQKQDGLFNLFLEKYKDKFINIHRYEANSRVWTNLSYFLKYSQNLDEFLKLSKTLYIDNIFQFSNCFSSCQLKEPIDTESKTFKEKVIPMIQEIKEPFIVLNFFKAFLGVYDSQKDIENFLNSTKNPELINLYKKGLVDNMKRMSSLPKDKKNLQPDSFYIDKHLKLYVKHVSGNAEEWVASICKRLELASTFSNNSQPKKLKI